MEDRNQFDPEILAEQRPYLEALARQLVLDPHAADDLVQETLLAAIKNPPRSSVRGFLGRVIRNLAYRSLRARERRHRREQAAARPDEQPATDELVARAVAAREVVDVLVELDEPYRTVLLLRFFDDLQPKQIAHQLNRKPATVRSQLKRGLERMRDRMDERHGGNRRAWCLPLLPFAFTGSTASAATAVVAGGMAAMSLQKKLTIAAALLVAVLGTTHLVRSQSRGGATGRLRAVRPSSTESEEPVDKEVAPRAEADRSGPTTTLTIEVRNLREEPVAGAEVALLRCEWGVPMGVPMAMEEPGWRWAVQSRPTPRALLVERTGDGGRATLADAPGASWDARRSASR